MGDKAIGIIGGMGPEASVDLFRKIIKATSAEREQDHLRVIIDCNPKLPDRVEAIFGNGEDPTPGLIEMAKNLERAGAGFLLIACNTAHYYCDAIAKHISIPILNIMEETAYYCHNRFPNKKVFGLLAGSVTVKLGLYAKAFGQIGRKILTPKAEDQEKVHRCVYKIKAGDLGSSVKNELLRVARSLSAKGAEAIILGCTEFPLILEEGDMQIPIIDPTEALAQSAVNRAKE